jgi:hypothetical protein
MVSSAYMRAGFVNTVSALCYSIVLEESGRLARAEHSAVSPNAVVNFVVDQQGRMPDYLRLPLFVLTLVFNLAGFRYGGSLFHRLDPSARQRQIAAWRRSRIGAARDLVRLYESLAIFCWTSFVVAQETAPAPAPIVVHTRVVVHTPVVVDTQAAAFEHQPA